MTDFTRPLPPPMDLREFVDKGYLQEANRRFFHPLGLALSVKATADGNIELHCIWDGRDDPEGFMFEGLTDAEREAGQGDHQAARGLSCDSG